MYTPDFDNITDLEETTYKEFKQSTKGYSKTISRLLRFEKFEIFGLIESIIGCPYSIANLKCLSTDAKVYQMSKEDFLALFQKNNTVKKTVKKKLVLMEQRINLALEQ